MKTSIFVTRSRVISAFALLLLLAGLIVALLVAATPAQAQTGNSPRPLPQIVLEPTDVTYIRALTNMNIRHGPSTAYPVVGKLLEGRQTAVLSVAQGGTWWQVVCPVGVMADCFVSANPEWTRAIAWRGDPHPDEQPAEGLTIETLEIRVAESYPPQIQAVLSGYLPDGCSSVYSVEQVRSKSTINLNFGISRRNGPCSQVIKLYKEVVVLDVEGLPMGEVWVQADGQWASFMLPVAQLPEDNVVATPVKWVLIRAGLPLFDGPGTDYPTVGYARAGEIAQVTAVSSDGGWWRIVCTSTVSGACYINAALADPTSDPSQPQFSDVPTDVRYVMAQNDVSIHEGPGWDYLPAGMIFGGMIARVEAMSVDGQWWRIECHDTTARACYVSANPAQTQPTSAP